MLDTSVFKALSFLGYDDSLQFVRKKIHSIFTLFHCYFRVNQGSLVARG